MMSCATIVPLPSFLLSPLALVTMRIAQETSPDTCECYIASQAYSECSSFCLGMLHYKVPAILPFPLLLSSPSTGIVKFTTNQRTDETTKAILLGEVPPQHKGKPHHHFLHRRHHHHHHSNGFPLILSYSLPSTLLPGSDSHPLSTYRTLRWAERDRRLEGDDPKPGGAEGRTSQEDEPGLAGGAVRADAGEAAQRLVRQVGRP